ncbi:MAG: universal stress protein [Magnetococcales bacterium]|nr:universal stress protein [Magnetococcales bacterium]
MVSKNTSSLYSNILVALDGSPHSNKCLERAVEFASLTPGAKVSGIHITEDNPKSITHDSDKSYTNIMNQAEQTCKKAKIPFKEFVVSGREHRVLSAEIRKGDFDLLVIGCAGVGANGRNEVGSVCEMVVRSSNIDTLVAKNFSRKEAGPVLVAVDGSHNSFGGVVATLELGQSLGREVSMVSAFDPDYHKAVFHNMGELPTEVGADLFASEEMEKLQQAVTGSGISKLYEIVLDIGKDIVDPKKVNVDYMPLVGKPAVAIRELVDAMVPSLLVMGKTGIHADGGLKIGSVTENLLHSTECDLLITNKTHIPQLKKKAIDKLHSVTTSSQEEQLNKTAENSQPQTVQDGEDALTTGLAARSNSSTNQQTVEQLPAMSEEAEQALMAASNGNSTEQLRNFLQSAALRMGLKSLDAKAGMEMLDAFNLGQDSGFDMLKWEEKDEVMTFLEGWVHGDVEEDDFILEDKPLFNDKDEISAILRQFGNQHIYVQIPGSNTQFLTHFDTGVDNKFAGNLNKLAIRPLLPANGNILIRKQGEATIRLHHDQSLLSFKVPFQSIGQSGRRRVLNLGFPEEISRINDQRKSQRIRVPETDDLHFEVVDNSGKVNKSFLFDMSDEGLAFHLPDVVQKISNGELLKFRMQVANKLAVNVEGMIVGHFIRDGKTFNRTKLRVKRPFVKNIVRDFVNFFQYEQKNKHKTLFN